MLRVAWTVASGNCSVSVSTPYERRTPNSPYFRLYWHERAMDCLFLKRYSARAVVSSHKRGFMTFLVNILAGIYLFCVIGLTVFSVGILTLLILWWRHRNDAIIAPPLNGVWPQVTVQLPIYNERSVVTRLIDAVAKLDYPRDRLHIQVLDDSDDDTGTVVAQLVARYLHAGLNITHIQRHDRTWYKAGALANGLKYTDNEFIAA